MIKISNNLKWRNRKICHLILVIREREVRNVKTYNSNARKTFHYASHAWSLPKGRHSLIAGNQIHHLQKQIKRPNCSRQYTENEIKTVRINFFWGIYRLYMNSEFAFVWCVGRKEKITVRWGLHFLTLSSRRHATIKRECIISMIYPKAMKHFEDAPNNCMDVLMGKLKMSIV